MAKAIRPWAEYRDDGFDQEVRSCRLSAELRSKPKSARRRDQSDKSQGGQIAIDADACRDRLLERGGSHAPDRVSKRRRRPGRCLEPGPEHDRSEKRDGDLQLPDSDRVASSADEQRNLIRQRQAWKHNRVDSPGDEVVASVPKRGPGQTGRESPEDRSFDDLRPIGRHRCDRDVRSGRPHWTG